MWSWSVHDVLTGTHLLDVECSSASWGRSPGVGDATHELQLRDAASELPRSVVRSLTEPNRAIIVQAWHGVPVYAGVTIFVSYARSTGVLSVRSRDVRLFAKERQIVGVGEYAAGIRNDLVLAGKSLAGLVRAVVARMMAADRGYPVSWALPIDLPADSSGPHSMTVRWWEWTTCEDLLQRVEQLGATIDFDPYFTATRAIRFATRVGTPALAGTTFEWVVTAPDSPVTGLTVSRDGSGQLTGAFFLGRGSEVDMVVGTYGVLSVATGMPVRDATRSAKDIDDVGVLKRMAEVEVGTQVSPVEQWAFDLVMDGSWDPALLKPGARVVLWTHGDEFLLDGRHDLTVTGVSGGHGNVLSVEVKTV